MRTTVLRTILIVLVIHLPSVLGEFAWDDHDTVLSTACPHLQAWRLFIPADFVRCSGELGYRPLVALSHRVDLAVWGTNPHGHHITNLLLHGAVAGTMAYGLLQIGIPHIPALLGTLLFATHPLVVEPVAGISYRTDIMASLFMILSLIMLQSNRSGFSILFFLLALLSKETTLLMPLLLVPLVWRRRRPWLFTSLLAMALFLFVRLGMGRSPEETMLVHRGGSPASAILHSPGMLFRALSLVAYPRICPDRSALVEVFGPGGTVASWIFMLGLALVLYVVVRRQRRTGLLLLSSLVFLVPILGFYPLKMVLSDRYMYASLLLLGGAAASSMAGLRSKFVPWIPGAVIALEALLSIQTHQMWWNELLLYERTAYCAPTSAQARYNYGWILIKHADYSGAEAQLSEAIRLEPRYAKAYLAMGVACYYGERYAEAIRYYREAEERSEPSERIAINIAHSYLALCDTADAVAEVQRALALQPEFEPALLLLERLTTP